MEQISKISSTIEDITKKFNIPYIEACIMYSEDQNIDLELIGEIIKKNEVVKDIIEKEANFINMLK